jgi:hypothetical protein
MAFEDDIATLARAPLFTVMEYEALRLFAFAAAGPRRCWKPVTL